MNILISTLGTTWSIIPETIGFVNYRKIDFYRNHPNIAAINSAREVAFGREEVEELWLVATDVPHTKFDSTKEAYQKIKDWNIRCGNLVPRIRLWVLKGIIDISNAHEADEFHDLTLKILAFAREKCKGGKLFLSLACGRKTMSADIQDAAYCFGCDAMIHILGEQLKNEPIDVLSEEDCRTTHPLCLGKYQANEVITGYEIPSFADDDCIEVTPDISFLEKIRKLQNDAKFFYTSYYLNQENDSRSNFQVLYTLPHDVINRLKESKFGINKQYEKQELEYLRQIPKTDLHCHLGGVLDCEDMISVAESYENDIKEELINNSKFQKWYSELDVKDFKKTPKNGWKKWQNNVASITDSKRYLVNAAVLLKFKGNTKELEKLLFGKYLNEALFRNIDIESYEKLGDFQGSALLQSEGAIRKTVKILLDKAELENVSYLEVRCSPMNYTEEMNPSQVLQCILEELEKNKPGMDKSLLLIASRHGDMNKISQSVELMKSMANKGLFVKYFRGFDLAGNEDAASPREMHDVFLDVLKECRNITIHAGETLQAESIWEAVYFLNAERVGHGLTLKNSPSLITKFLERKIGIEMCPSSNYQIKGFKDNYILESQFEDIYPLKEYLDKELRVSVNTDNPGISRTSATEELLRAARLTPGGLSIWNLYQLIYNGFLSAFYPYEQKKRMIKKAEDKIGEMIRNEQI